MLSKLNMSSQLMYEAAQELGIQCHVFEDNDTILMQKDGKTWYTRGSRTSLQSSVGKSIADNKFLAKMVLNYHQLPTAKAERIAKIIDLPKLKNLHFPIALKPIAGRYGMGVRVGITSYEEAEQLYRTEGYADSIAEEMLTGTEYRILCVDYRFVAATYRQPAHVVGDGLHNISELVEQKNAHPWRGMGHHSPLTKILIDDMVKEYLAEQQVTVDQVPAKDQVVWLRKTANLSTGGEAWDVTDEVCEENKSLFAKIARACDLNVIGIDIMCQTLTTPITDQPKAGVIEVNASPGLRMHHFPMKGTPRAVAKTILEFVLVHLH